ncbi:MAG TPA: helix-turn-helix domain-containing protein [Mizugakiibacter sp.]
MARDIDPPERLRREFAKALTDAGLDLGTAQAHATTIVHYLQRTYAGDELYIPARGTIPREDILAAHADGMPVRSICKRFRISSKTFYSLFDDDGAPDG